MLLGVVQAALCLGGDDLGVRSVGDTTSLHPSLWLFQPLSEQHSHLDFKITNVARLPHARVGSTEERLQKVKVLGQGSMPRLHRALPAVSIWIAGTGRRLEPESYVAEA